MRKVLFPITYSLNNEIGKTKEGATGSLGDFYLLTLDLGKKDQEEYLFCFKSFSSGIL